MGLRRSGRSAPRGGRHGCNSGDTEAGRLPASYCRLSVVAQKGEAQGPDALSTRRPRGRKWGTPSGARSLRQAPQTPADPEIVYTCPVRPGSGSLLGLLRGALLHAPPAPPPRSPHPPGTPPVISVLLIREKRHQPSGESLRILVTRRQSWDPGSLLAGTGVSAITEDDTCGELTSLFRECRLKVEWTAVFGGQLSLGDGPSRPGQPFYLPVLPRSRPRAAFLVLLPASFLPVPFTCSPAPCLKGSPRDQTPPPPFSAFSPRPGVIWCSRDMGRCNRERLQGAGRREKSAHGEARARNDLDVSCSLLLILAPAKLNFLEVSDCPALPSPRPADTTHVEEIQIRRIPRSGHTQGSSGQPLSRKAGTESLRSPECSRLLVKLL